MRYKLCTLLFSFLLVQSLSVRAATFCVASGPELQQALITAANNGEGDSIRLQEGLYTASSGTVAFTYDSAESVDLIGGYSSPGAQPCSLRTERARLTVLSGSNVRRVLSLSNGPARVFNLTIKDGFSTTPGGGMYMNTVNGVVVGNVIFEGNTSEATGGALEILTGGTSNFVWGNLFMNNQCDLNACAIHGVFTAPASSIHHVFFAGNTVVGNRCGSGSAKTCVTGGAKFGGTARSRSYNNAFANNDGFDLDIQGSNGSLYNSNVPNKRGAFDPDAGNLGLVDPLFMDPVEGNYRLRFGSFLINSGTSNWDMPQFDLDGNSRFNVPFDMGAYERAVSQLFVDGFESD